MAGDRFVVLGVAQVRSPWFREVARWATSAMLPIEFVKAMSCEEVRVRLRSGRGYSALLVDDSLPGVDRDLVDLAREAGCAVLIVDSGRGSRRWGELGASALLSSAFARDELLQVLQQTASPITRSTGGSSQPADDGHPIGFRGRLVAVTGPPGAGRSTVAAALAQGLARDARNADMVCLADLALHADQAMLHQSPDVVPGLTELVEGHRSGTPSVDSIRDLTWKVTERGYYLLLGLRRHRDWTAIRPRAFAAALDGLRRGFTIVVADVDDDVEGEQATGSIDVEERNTIARTTTMASDLVVVVGQPGLTGLHSHVRTTRALVDLGVPGHQLLPVINRSPKGPRARAELTSAFGELLGVDGAAVPTPLHVPDRRHLDQTHRDVVRFNDGWIAPLVGTVQALIDREPEAELAPPMPALEPVRPGSLGSWADEGPEG
jgi:MinD-like ATPase involved in chromosome partitioning or flagellar assembly